MLARYLGVLLLVGATATFAQETQPQETQPQELKGKEASEFLTMASGMIKANCDAIESWKGKIEAQHAAPMMSNMVTSTIDTTFAIATNGDVLVHLEKMSGYSVIPRDAGGVLQLREPNKPHSIEYFVHGDVVDRATFFRNLRLDESTLPSRITTQIRKEKLKDELPPTFLNPQSLFLDSGDKRMDEQLEKAAQIALREDSTVVVSKPVGGDGIWTLKVQYKGSDPTAPRMQVTWKLDEAQCFLPTSRNDSMAEKKLSERTIEYQQIGTVFLPKLVVETGSKRFSRFKVTTESLNQGPEKIEIKHRDNDLLTDVDRKHFKFLSGEFLPYDPITREIKK